MANPYIETLLENASIQPTKARIAILEIFAKQAKPLDMVSVISLLSKSSLRSEMDRATVFRTLNTFVEKGILNKLEFNEGKSRYELASKGHHNHTICTRCGTVSCIEECNLDVIEREIHKKTGFTTNFHRAEFFGICGKCSNTVG